MTDSISIQDIAREIRPLLPELLGENAEAVERELAGLLAQAESGEDVDYEIRALLGEHEATDSWKRKRLQANKSDVLDERYSPLAGNLADIPYAPEYACPVPGCNSLHWFPVDTGDVIPSCQTHNVPFKPISNI